MDDSRNSTQLNNKAAQTSASPESFRRVAAGTALTLVGASFWGLCSVVSKYLIADKGLDTMWMTDFRMTSAGIIMLALASVRNSKGIFDIWKDAGARIRLILLALVGFGICQVSYFLAIEYCNAGIATALQQTAPIFVLVLVLFRDRRRPRAYEIIVLAVTVFGSFMLATGGSLSSMNISPAALACGLISAVSCVGYIMMPGPLITVYGTFETIGWGLLTGGLLIAPICRLWNPQLTPDAGTVAGLAFIVILGAVVPFASYLYGTTIVGPVKASIFGLLEPVIATFASLIFLGQNFSIADYIGISAILIGIIVLSVKKNK